MKCMYIKVALVSLMIIAASCSKKRYTDALSPEEALKSFVLNEDFRIELFAAEPFVTDPVEMVFDEQGNVYAVEMPDYPYRPESGIGSGKIRMLSDTSGDGVIDKSTIFADSLLEATSILPWDGGLIVTAAPNIFFLKDTNGDGRADKKELLFSGFFNNNAETQITNLRFGVDNWIYAANFGQEGKVISTRNPGAAPLLTSGGDFRFRMDKGFFELESGVTQFGHAMDDWGHRFITENSIHIQQPVIPWRYINRNPYLPYRKVTANISDHQQLMFQITPAPYWRAERTKQRNEVFREQKLDRVEYADDHFTGASGTTIYAADVFPEKYYGNIFVGDVAGSLVHRDVIDYNTDSVVFFARRDETEKDREFLASTDPWFRPVNFTAGPDGALYVIDIYRQHIEAPPFIPEELKKDMDFLNGNKMGRIYRIIPKNGGIYKKNPLNLKSAKTGELVDQLSNPNQWWRLQAQRLLLERQDMSAVPALKNMLTQNKDPRARLHALYALEALNALDASLVKQAMKDIHPGVRESAIKLSEKYQECVPVLLELLHDSATRVALQATLSLGEFSASPIVPALAGVMDKYGHNPWFRLAVLSSEHGSSLPLFEILIKKGFFSGETKPESTAFLEDFSYVVGARNRQDEMAGFLKLLGTAGLKEKNELLQAAFKGLAGGIKKSDKKMKPDAAILNAFKEVETGATKEQMDAIDEIKKLME